MRALSVASSVVRHLVGVGAQALLVAAIIVTLLLALAPIYRPADILAGTKAVNAAPGGKLTATISFPATAASRNAYASGEVTFAVTRSIAENRDVFWVTNTCYDLAGQTLSKVDLAVVWGMWNSLEGTAGPFVASGSHCRAIVTFKPWLGRPLGDAVFEYDVAS
jgi:hypothetical protein